MKLSNLMVGAVLTASVGACDPEPNCYDLRTRFDEMQSSQNSPQYWDAVGFNCNKNPHSLAIINSLRQDIARTCGPNFYMGYYDETLTRFKSLTQRTACAPVEQASVPNEN